MSDDDCSIRSTPARFVGRTRELAELSAGLDDARSGRGRFFLITGEPGIGKSRLADEVASQAASGATAVLRASYWEGGGTPAYWPFVQMLRAAIAAHGRNSFLKLISAQRTPDAIQDLAQLVPELHPRTTSAAEAAVLDPTQTRLRLFDSVTAAFRTLAAVRPLLLIFEDLHDADQPSLQMLRFLTHQLKNAPVMVLATYRDIEVQHSLVLSSLIGDLIREGAQLPLLALSQEDAARMIEARAATPPSPRRVSDIYQATAGNPLFIDGLVRVLSAEGKLNSAGRLNLSAFRVPDGVREAIRRWLDLLTDRPVMVIAAMIGQTFELKCLQRVTQTPNPQQLDALRQASDLGIVTALSHGAYRFTHALIRNALCDELNSADRAGLHKKIGQAIEELYRVDVEVHAAALAHHFREAGDTNKAIDYSIRAGDAARAVFAYEEAIAHWKAALQAMPEHSLNSLQRAAVCEHIAESLGLTASSGNEQFDYWRKALKIYKAHGRPEAARVEAGIVNWFSMRGGAPDDLRQEVNHSLISGSIAQDRESTSALAWRYLMEASTASQAGRIAESMAAAHRVMEICKQTGDESLSAKVGSCYSACLFALGRLDDTFANVRRLCERADRVNDATSGAGILSVYAYALSWLCDPKVALIRLDEEWRKPRMAEASLLQNVLFDWQQLLAALNGKLPKNNETVSRIQSSPPSESAAAFYVGDWERAELDLISSVNRARHDERHVSTCTSGHWLARVRRVRGVPSDSEAILHKNLALCLEAPHIPLELHTRGELASIHAETGRTVLADAHLARCREILANGQDWRGLVGHIERAEGVVAGAEARFDAANQHFDKAVEIYRRYQVPFEEAEALHYWGRALIAAGERSAAIEKLDGASEIYRRHGAGERWLQRVDADRPRAHSVDARKRVRPQEGRLKAAFRRQGEYWTLCWSNSESRLRDRRGLHYIARLLRNPGDEFAVQDLVSAIEPADGGRRSPAGIDEQATIARGLGDAGASLDQAARTQYKRRLRELQEELEEAEQDNDIGRAARLRHEVEFIAAQLSGAVGLNGRDRKAASHAERARVAVTKAIKAALGRIRAADPALGRHLSLSIQTGYFCAYIPRQPVTWEL